MMMSENWKKKEKEIDSILDVGIVMHVTFGPLFLILHFLMKAKRSEDNDMQQREGKQIMPIMNTRCYFREDRSASLFSHPLSSCIRHRVIMSAAHYDVDFYINFIPILLV